jgi:hypothetical protein
MTREEKIKLAIEKGITCNPKTGEVFGMKGCVIGSVDNRNRCKFAIQHQKRNYYIMTHQFIWYWVNNQVVDCIDHIDRNPSNNSISNLRSISQQKNLLNRDFKGYTRIKRKNGYKLRVGIVVDGEWKYIGLYDNEVEAHNAYLNAKKIYHII